MSANEKRRLLSFKDFHGDRTGFNLRLRKSMRKKMDSIKKMRHQTGFRNGKLNNVLKNVLKKQKPKNSHKIAQIFKSEYPEGVAHLLEHSFFLNENQE
jgi:hypothetical protein